MFFQCDSSYDFFRNDLIQPKDQLDLSHLSLQLEAPLQFINTCLVIYHNAIDVIFRFEYQFHRILAKFVRKSLYQGKVNNSDSQALGYENRVSELISDKVKFRKFRRNFEYRMILEHVSYRQGLDYLKRINKLGIVNNDSIIQLAKSDNFGDPWVYYYRDIGWASPTLLRYVSVYSEIETAIGFKSIDSIVEIGIGYGGQARVINELSHVSRYEFYDLRNVQKLAILFLEKVCPRFSPECLDIENVEHAVFDLVISNYAISELPIDVQKEYLDKVLKPSAHCYLIMNSGATNKTGRSSGKLSQEAFLTMLPRLKIQPEIPLTGPDNYVLIR